MSFLSQQEHISDGTLQIVPFSIAFLDVADLHFYIGSDEVTSTVPVGGVFVQQVTQYQVSLTAPVPTGVVFSVRRVTPRTSVPHIFNNGAALFNAANTDENNTHTLFIVQEVYEQSGLGPFPGITTIDGTEVLYVTVGGVRKQLTLATLLEQAPDVAFNTFKKDLENQTDPLKGAALSGAYDGRTVRDELNDIPVPITRFANLVVAGDWTDAIQTALNTHRNVYIPPSATPYTSKKLIAAFDGQQIFGAGYSSCIALKVGETGVLLDPEGKRVTIQNLRLFGLDDGGKTSIEITDPSVSGVADRSGLFVYVDTDSTVDRVIIHGFGNRALKSNNTAANRNAGTTISNCHFYNCWAGLDAGVGNAEYLRGSNNSVGGCQQGVISASGNQTFVGGIVSDNYINFVVNGNAVPNDSHGSAIGVLLNHATKYNIFTDGVDNGFVFSGCNIFAGEGIYLKNSNGVQISNGTIDVNNFFFEGGGRNVISNNFSPMAFVNGVNHNYNGSTSNSVLIGNFVSSGQSRRNDVSVFGYPVYTGSADVPFLHFGTTGLIDSYGMTWTSNAATERMKALIKTNGVLGTVPVMEIDSQNGKFTAMRFNLQNFASDAAAATGGIPVGGMYRNGSLLQVRVV